MALPAQKKRVRYSVEKLNLLCEWENCTVVQDNIDVFLSHITTEHLTKLDPEDLHCHWKDCEGFTDNFSEFRRHILLHAFHTKIKCYGANLLLRKMLPNCTESIESRNIIPELPEQLLCYWEDCRMVYECPDYFYRHVDSHAEHDCKRDDTFICLWQECSRTFSDSFKVKDHLRSHTQEKLVACPTCGGMFSNRTKFLDHIQRQLVEDKDEGAFACEYCPRKMSSERLLRDHIRHHVNHYKCPYCDMTCPTPSGIQSHVAYRHTSDKPHACQYCDYKSKTESDLRKHLGSHAMDATYKCPAENCTYATRSPTCFKTHYRKEHEGKKPLKYSCHLCEKTCSRGNYLTKHLLNHHKFRWPSGHSRFRYCLNEEGVYQLQTVRYESLELSQEMMGENSEMMGELIENIDDPSAILTVPHPNDTYSSITSPTTAVTQHSNSHIPQNAMVTGNSVILNIQEGTAVQTQTPEGQSIVYVPYRKGQEKSVNVEEPVLIKILDVNDGPISVYPDQNVLLTHLEPSDQHPAVQSITKNSKGVMVFETVDIAPQSLLSNTS